MQPVGGIDIDQDDSQFAGGELCDGPLGAVRRPDAHTLALLETQVQQAPCTPVNLCLELAIRPMNVLVA